MAFPVEERLALIKKVGEEIIEEEELRALLEKKEEFVAYDGFEPSGKVHIAQAVLRAINVNRMVKAGARFKMLVADWHAWANQKLGGSLEKIRLAGEYFIEVWKASGMDLSRVEFVWGSDLAREEAYWRLVMNVARLVTLKRVLRTTQIMGRAEGETLHASQIIYPCMQTADIFYLGADVCQLGLDQRKVNVLARELAPKLGKEKPVIVSHHMLLGLAEPPRGVGSTAERAIEMKMSKSRPETAIFVTDSEEEVARKLRKAYCPAGRVGENPVLEYWKHIIFSLEERVVIERSPAHGGNLAFSSYEELEHSFASGELHPADLKNATITYVNKALAPIREHFASDQKARKLRERVDSFTITR